MMRADTLQSYPTPEPLVLKLVAPYVKGEHAWNQRIHGVVLDPSAGFGGILSVVKNKYTGGGNYAGPVLLGIEVEVKAQMVLAGLGVKLLAYDFLRYGALEQHVDYIFMNPPFRYGAEHLLHAREIASPGCEIACILNKKTLSNAYSNDREALERLVVQYGSVEDVGQPFIDAERPTDVHCIIVRLTKPKKEKAVNWDAINLEPDPEPTPTPSAEDFMETALASRQTIAGLVQSFESVKDLIAQRDALIARIAKILNGAKIHPSRAISSPEDLRAAYWEWVWKATTIGERTTSQFRKEFDALLASSQSVAFTEENILHVLQAFVADAPDIMQQCITDAFDAMTLYHRQNRDSRSAWATNDSYQIAPKIILP